MKFDVPQASILGPLLLFNNDLSQALKFCEVQHFADDRNLLHFSKLVKTYKYVTLNLKYIAYWLNGNNFSLNVIKNWVSDLQTPKEKLSPIIKLSHKRLYPSKSVKYLGVKSDENLNWKQDIYDIAIKLNRANILLFTIRNYVYRQIPGTIRFAILDTCINYANLISSQNLKTGSRIVILQKKSLKNYEFSV